MKIEIQNIISFVYIILYSFELRYFLLEVYKLKDENNNLSEFFN